MEGDKPAGHVRTMTVSIDRTKPMWGQVGKLGDDYWEWVHKAEPGRARFFRWGVLEALTVSLWWVGPVFFLPIMVAVLWSAYSSGVSTRADIVSGLCLGFALWQVHEYGAHRYIFHRETSSPTLIALHFILHGSHHKYPMDKYRCVFPVAPAGALAVFWWVVLSYILPSRLSSTVWSGMLLGFLSYDLVHYTLHLNYDLPSDFLKVLRARHNVHHYRNPDHAFGVSSEIFDVLFNTN